MTVCGSSHSVTATDAAVPQRKKPLEVADVVDRHPDPLTDAIDKGDRARALELAKDTDGVTKVVDQLAVK